jgi:hypothetical protein
VELQKCLKIINHALNNLAPGEKARLAGGEIRIFNYMVKLSKNWIVETSKIVERCESSKKAVELFVSEVLQHKNRRFFSREVFPSELIQSTKLLKKAITGLFDQGAPALGIDLDGTIDEAPDFFWEISNSWKGMVYVITYRDDEKKARDDAEKYGVRVDAVILVNSFEEKSRKIKELGITCFFDDMDEVLQHIAPECKVFKVRNEGNFDFESKRWLYSKSTGEQI